MLDVNIVGSGPNGLAAAVVFARAGLSVRVTERADTPGGGLRTEQLTLPGYRHDSCSAVHPAALASPFFRAFELTARVPFVVPDVSYAHPLGGGRAAIAYRDLDRTAEGLGRGGQAWARLFQPLVTRLEGIVAFTGNQLLRWPDDPLAVLRYGADVLELGTALGRARLRGADAAALFAGVAAHVAGRQPSLAAAGAGLLLAAHAHAGGWGYPRGGSQAIADALVDDLTAHGGSLLLGTEVHSIGELEPARVTMLDTSPAFLASFASRSLPVRYRRALEGYRYGSGVAKVDFALSGPVPWANPEVALAPTVHLGGSRAEVAAAEREVSRGRVGEYPFVLVTQPSVLDDSRAPAGHHVLWAYTHVPRGSNIDMTDAVVRRIEGFAPGFRDTILASASLTAQGMAEHDPNFVGGDILGGEVTVRQLVRRPVVSRRPWQTPVPGLYLCSASTPPGPAVHGMNGWYAATLALRDEFGITVPPSLAP
ncbi:NAD(P)/FAD-dependent oxidoreductase [Cryobacterium sp. Sr8]|uniref:phytoene desaturase family protein n=1 Tax=Cryobacterium sp. Sr8 TaxID=1259203 RepID=UPI00106CF28F|nr:NAD(P)/FAD-dependent oxidoreductase [Cryobacterium sp. Sr8]TFD77876.1 NAD(P)/FAD-dependent oxidoreductase [Cryobacterium sp. Sr8]